MAFFVAGNELARKHFVNRARVYGVNKFSLAGAVEYSGRDRW